MFDDDKDKKFVAETSPAPDISMDWFVHALPLLSVHAEQSLEPENSIT